MNQKVEYALLVVIPVITMALISNQSVAASSILDDDYSHAHKTTRFHWDPICGEHVCTPQEKSKLHTISQSDNMSTPSQLTGYVLTDKSYYQIGQYEPALVLIHGNIPSVEYGTLSVTIKTPYNDYTTLMTHTNSTGSFFATYVVEFGAPGGIYHVAVDYEDMEMTTTFLVSRG